MGAVRATGSAWAVSAGMGACAAIGAAMGAVLAYGLGMRGRVVSVSAGCVGVGRRSDGAGLAAPCARKGRDGAVGRSGVSGGIIVSRAYM